MHSTKTRKDAIVPLSISIDSGQRELSSLSEERCYWFTHANNEGDHIALLAGSKPSLEASEQEWRLSCDQTEGIVHHKPLGDIPRWISAPWLPPGTGIKTSSVQDSLHTACFTGEEQRLAKRFNSMYLPQITFACIYVCESIRTADHRLASALSHSHSSSELLKNYEMQIGPRMQRN